MGITWCKSLCSNPKKETSVNHGNATQLNQSRPQPAAAADFQVVTIQDAVTVQGKNVNRTRIFSFEIMNRDKEIPQTSVSLHTPSAAIVISSRNIYEFLYLSRL